MNVWPKLPAASCAVRCVQNLLLVSYLGQTRSNGIQSEVLLWFSSASVVAIIPTVQLDTLDCGVRSILPKPLRNTCTVP